MDFFGIAQSVILVVLLFSGSIFVHELGHFLVARWCGLKINAFSIGFGHALFRKVHNGVEYKIGILPLGGYVSLPQMDPTGNQLEGLDDEGGKLPPISPGKKIAVALAGAVCNFIFAFFLAVLVWKMGLPGQPSQLYPTVGYVEQDSEAWDKGLRIGVDILSLRGVGGTKVHHFDNFNQFRIEASLHSEVEVAYTMDGGATTNRVVLKTKKDKERMGIHGIPGLGGRSSTMVRESLPDGPAASVGLQLKDIILSFNGVDVLSRAHLTMLIQEVKDTEVPIVFKRGDEVIHATIRPEKSPDYPDKYKYEYRIGLAWLQDYNFEEKINPEPLKQIAEFSTMIFRILGALTNPREAPQAMEGLSGPVGIIWMFWAVSEAMVLAFWFTALLNVNLAIMNLLPIPILDGGHIMFALWEWITRRPASPKFVLVVSNIFLVLILTAFIMLTYRDVGRFVVPSIKNMNKQEEVQPPPKPPDPPVEIPETVPEP